MFYYSKTCQELITPSTVLIHPDTGEKYGGSDWQNQSKLLEVDAIPVEVIDINKLESYVLDSEVVSYDEETDSATLTRTWREKNSDELAEEVKQTLLSLDYLSPRKVEDLWVLLLEKNIIQEEDVPSAVLEWINVRIAERAKI